MKPVVKLIISIKLHSYISFNFKIFIDAFFIAVSRSGNRQVNVFDSQSVTV